MVAAQLSVLASILIYFGTVATRVEARFFGLDPSQLDYSNQEFLVRSIAPMLGPLTIGGAVAVFVLQVNTLAAAPSLRPARPLDVELLNGDPLVGVARPRSGGSGGPGGSDGGPWNGRRRGCRIYWIAPCHAHRAVQDRATGPSTGLAASHSVQRSALLCVPVGSLIGSGTRSPDVRMGSPNRSVSRTEGSSEREMKS